MPLSSPLTTSLVRSQREIIVDVSSKLEAVVFDNHLDVNTTTSHVISNIVNLQDILDTKAHDIHTHVISDIVDLQDTLDAKVHKNGYTGSVTVVTGVDFNNQSTTTATISYVDGQITAVN